MLVDLQASQLEDTAGPQVAEAWAVDCPNHGEGGMVNDVEFRDKPGLTSTFDILNVLPVLRVSD